MRIITILFLFCCTLPIIFVAHADIDGKESQGMMISLQNSSDPIRVADIQTLLSSPDQYAGKRIELDAIVSKIHTPNHMFTVADKISCPLCITKNTQSSLIVRFSGDLPKLRETVHIVGMIHLDPKFGHSLYAFEVQT